VHYVLGVDNEINYTLACYVLRSKLCRTPVSTLQEIALEFNPVMRT